MTLIRVCILYLRPMLVYSIVLYKDCLHVLSTAHDLLYANKFSQENGRLLSCWFFFFKQHQVFTYVHYVMSEDVYTDLEREELKEATLNSLQVSFVKVQSS